MLISQIAQMAQVQKHTPHPSYRASDSPCREAEGSFDNLYLSLSLSSVLMSSDVCFVRVCTCVCQVPVWVLGRGDRHLEDIMTGEAAMTRIRDTPVVRPAIPNQASNQAESPRPI